MTPVDSSKADVRKRVKGVLAGLAPEVRLAASDAICRRVRELGMWKTAETVLLYAPIRHEPDLWPMVFEALSEGRRVALPVFDPGSGVYGARRISDPERDLVPGSFGVREPGPGCPVVPLAALDLVVVPGLAFSLEGWRLGRGGGFYDRILQATPAVRCGVAFDEQVVVHLPVESHDAQLDLIVTPSAIHPSRRMTR